jgi:putative ABC transport system ATP-binding protein
MEAQPIIETKDLIKVYGTGEIAVRALGGVNVRIDPGEFVAVMGPSGSGKSTLMNILGCLDRPTTGSYLLDGQDVSRYDKKQLAAIRGRKLGFIFQSFNLLSRTTSLKNVMLPLIYDKENVHAMEERESLAMQALASVGLADRANHRPNELSGGQRQRVAIARALVNDPVLILADEPTGNLDTRSSYEIMDILHELHDRGRTIVMVTHEPDIAAHTQRTICVRDGQVVSDGRDGASGCVQGAEGR